MFNVPFVTNSRAKPQKPRRWKSMLIHQGWFTALHIQHLLDSQSFELEICIFPREAIPITLLPPPRRLVPSLGRGTTWVRQLRSSSCHHPTAATKCNEQPSQATETPSVEKHAHPPRVVYCATYSTLTRFTKFRVGNLHTSKGGYPVTFGVSSAENVTNSRAKPQKPRRWKSMLIHQGWFTALHTQHLLDSQSFELEICIFPREAIPSHYFPLREDSSRVLAWGLHG